VPLTGDIDGDGRTDLIVWRPDTGTFFWLISSANYDYASQGAKQWGSASLGDVPFIGDFDGDGKSDIAVWRASTGTWYWLQSSFGFDYANRRSKQWGSASHGDVPLVGDFDGDRKTDLAVWRASTGTWFWLTSSTDYEYAGQASRQWGSQAQQDVPMLGDLDGDGRAELIVWRPGNGLWFSLSSRAGYSYAAQTQNQWGVSGDVPLLR
jgi:FG-GAP repeat.